MRSLSEFHITVRGKRWLLTFMPLKGDADGTCDPPMSKGKRIRVNSSLKGERRLEVTIHELLHAAHWDISEEAIEGAARDIARVLWRVGYREIESE